MFQSIAILLLALGAVVAETATSAAASNKTIPRYLLRHYQHGLRALPSDGKGYNTVRNYNNLGSQISCYAYHLRFNLSHFPSDEEESVLGARIHLELDSGSAFQQTRYRLRRGGLTGFSKGQLLMTKSVQAGFSEDVTFNVTQLVIDALKMKKTAFLDFVLTMDVVPSVAACPPSTSSPFVAMLEVESNSDVHSPSPSDIQHLQETSSTTLRRKRSYSRNRATSNAQKSKSICQRHPLHIDFSTFGWDTWIIAPFSYDAYFCAGICPYPINSHLNSSNHAVLQNLAHYIQPDALPLACCAPTKLSTLSVIFQDIYNVLVYKKYEDMVVEECGCV